jgi:HEAT repeat protein
VIGQTEPAPGEKPILVDLAAVGYEVISLASLRESGIKYKEAIPTLVDWLERASDSKVKGELARALSVPWAKSSATQPLIRAFRDVDPAVDPTGTGLRWTIGNALNVLFHDAHFSAYVDLASDSRHGAARQMVVLALGRSRNPEAVRVLLSLVDEPDVDGHAIQALAKLKAPAARAALVSKLDDPRAWVRSQARRGLNGLPE